MSNESAREILTIKNAAKAQLIGAQDQKFYLEFDTHQLAGLGVSRDEIISEFAGAERGHAVRRRPDQPREIRGPRLRVRSTRSTI